MVFFQRIANTKCWFFLLFLAINLQIATASNYEVTVLVSDLANQKPQTNSNHNPWGLFFASNGNFSVTSNESNLPMLSGNIVNFIAKVSFSPVGTVRNTSTHDFCIGKGMNQHPASFLYAAEDGTISGFNGAVNPQSALIVADRSSFGAIYKGLCTASTCCGDKILLATDFHNGHIDLFDTNFHYLSSITAPNIPAGYAPFNIKNINGQIYVTFAKQYHPANQYDEPGSGNGFIAIFSIFGKYVKTLVSQGSLNSPWGLALAPKTFGDFAGALLVGNFGDGLIHAYDINTGSLLGHLTNKMGHPIQINGLWALEFDSNSNLYFNAVPYDKQNGVAGTISLVP